MSNRTSSNFNSTYNTVFADNTTRDISEGDLRSFKTDMSESLLFKKFSTNDLGTDPSSWDLQSFDTVDAICELTTNGSFTITNTRNNGKYRLLITKSTASTITLTFNQSGIGEIYPENGINVSLSGSSGDKYLIQLNRVGNYIAISDMTQYGSSSSSVLKTSTTISSAEIKNINTSPKEIIAAPGSGKFIMPLKIYGKYIYDTAAYATSTNVEVLLGSVQIHNATGILNQSVDTWFFYPGGSTITTGTIENTALNISSNSDPTSGSGTLEIYVTYIILDTL